jgi:hypothetical protein
MSNSSNPPPAQSQSNRLRYVKRASLFPKELSSALTISLEQALQSRGFGEHDIARHWQKIVGTELSEHCKPVKLIRRSKTEREGKLYVRAKGAHALEVQYNEPLILERLAAFYGFTIAHRIIILQ